MSIYTTKDPAFKWKDVPGVLQSLFKKWDKTSIDTVVLTHKSYYNSSPCYGNTCSSCLFQPDEGSSCVRQDTINKYKWLKKLHNERSTS